MATQPTGQTCAVAGSGTMGKADIANVVVSCSDRTGQIGVDITGLGAASGLKLTNNQVEHEVPGGSTAYTFPALVPVGAQYSLAVTASPAGLVCSLPATSGTFPGSSADAVLNVGTVSCAVAPPPTYSIGGYVNGLAGTGLQLALNGGGALSIAGNGVFAFSGELLSGAPYAVTVLQEPSGQTCSVTSGSGTVASADITSVQVNCANTPTTFTVGGTIIGLTGAGLSLLDVETSEMLSVAAGAAQFTFPAARSPGDPYDVILGELNGGTFQPTGQYCSLTNGSGTVGSSNVTNIQVNCQQAFSISGSIVGLAPGITIMLRNANAPYGGYTGMLGDGSFTIDDPRVPVGSAYNIEIDGGNPPGYSCNIANGMGVMGPAPVVGVMVTCSL